MTSSSGQRNPRSNKIVMMIDKNLSHDIGRPDGAQSTGSSRIDASHEGHRRSEERQKTAVIATEDDLPTDKQDASLQRDTEPASNEDLGPAYSTARQVALVLCVTGAAFLNTVAVQAVVICLPAIGRDLDIPASREQWVVSAYSLTFGCFLLLFGKLADVFGKRRVYLAGSAWLTVITIAIPFLRNEIAFDLFRGLQGMGSAANVPTAIGILGIVFPPGKSKNYAFAVYAGGAPMGAVFGNILGGVLSQYASWEWVFWVLSIFAATITVASYIVIPSRMTAALSNSGSTKRTVDWVGAFLVTVGVSILLFALTEGNVIGWSTPWIGALIGVSVILIVVFVLHQHHLETRTRRTPLMKVSLFRGNATFSAAMLIMFLFFAAFNNYLVLATTFYQTYAGLSAIQTTLRFIPMGVAGTLIVLIMAQVLGRVRGNHILLFGNACVGLACLLFALPIPPHTTYWAYGLPAMCLSVLGADTLFPTLTLFTSRSLPPEDQALGGGLINAVSQIGRAIGLAVATAIQVAVTAAAKGADVDDVGSEKQTRGDPALLDGLRAAEYFGFGLAMTALLLAGFAFRNAGIVGRA